MIRTHARQSLARQGILAGLVVTALASPSYSQERPRRPRRQRPAVYLIKVKRAHTAQGEAISPAILMVQGNRIMSVRKTKPAGNTRRMSFIKELDLSHLEAIPALVDPMATTFLDSGDRAGNGPGAGAPTHRGLVTLRPDQVGKLLKAGVVGLCLVPAYGSGISAPATGVLIGANGRAQVTKKISSLALRFSTSGPSDSLGAEKSWKTLKKFFADAKAYKKKKEEAEKKLEEYEKKWKEYIAAWKKKSGVDKGKKKAPAKSAKKSATKGKKTTPAAKKRPSTGPPIPRRRRQPRKKPGGLYAADKPEKAPVRKTTPKKPGSKATAAKSTKKPAGKDPVRPKRPAPFKVDPAKEVLLKVMADKIPVRMEAHSKQEVHYALRLAHEFRLNAVLVEPWELAAEDKERIEKLKLPVLFGKLDRKLPAPTKLGFTPCMPQRWAKLGCPVILGTGGFLSSRFLRDQAAFAAGMGLTPLQALQAVTINAARISGLEKDCGSLEKGKRANILFFAGDPLDPTNSPERIMINGKFIKGEVKK